MSPHRLAELWVRRFEAIRDAELRVGYATHELGRLTPDTLAELVGELVAGVESGATGHRDLLETLFVALASPNLYSLRREAADRARDTGDREVVRLLAVPACPASDRPRGKQVARGTTSQDPRTGRPLTLGERKALARARDRQTLAHAFRDPHPGVIRILLANPVLVEADVIRLCAQRPANPESLGEVFRHRRWSVRYRIQLALVKNPACPLDIAVQLASQLRRPDALEVAAAEDLRDDVRRAALSAARRGSIPAPRRTLH